MGSAAIACARENQVVLFEAFKTACLRTFICCARRCRKSEFRKVFQLLPVFLAVSTFLDGENPNTLIRHSLTVQLWISASTTRRR
ncbi:hypothetical protein ACNKHR_17090 [Shigella flexneri]